MPDGRVVRRAGPSCTLLIGGVAALWLALTSDALDTGVLKIPIVCAALVAAYKGLIGLGGSIWGARFDGPVVLSIAWLGALIAAALLADVLPLAEHVDTSATIGVEGNSRPDLLSEHPLGTNNFALDLLARCIHGARVSLLTVLVALSLATVIGGGMGVMAGYLRGRWDRLVGVATDSLLSFPPLVLLVAISAVIGRPTSVLDAVVKSGAALALVSVPTFARLARANTLAIAEREFVVATRAMGATDSRIVMREIVPIVVVPVVTYSFTIASVLIIAEGSLAFLGLGLQQPSPTWGNMIAEGSVAVLRESPHVPFIPGAFMLLTVISLNVLGDRLAVRFSR